MIVNVFGVGYRGFVSVRAEVQIPSGGVQGANSKLSKGHSSVLGVKKRLSINWNDHSILAQLLCA